MIGWAANGDQIYDFGHLRSVTLGEWEVFVDVNSKKPNEKFADFQIPVYGDVALREDVDIVTMCRILGNILENHHIIFGSIVNNLSDEAFCVSLPSHKGILSHIEWSDLLLDKKDCKTYLNMSRMAFFREILSEEDFFRMFPHTGCPYLHCWDDEQDDIESTCTLCEGYRSRSPMASDERPVEPEPPNEFLAELACCKFPERHLFESTYIRFTEESQTAKALALKECRNLPSDIYYCQQSDFSRVS